MSAVVDRIEGDRAVLLVGSEETELTVSAGDLPAGATEGTWLRLQMDVTAMELDEEKQVDREGRIDRKLNRLRRRGSRLDS